MVRAAALERIRPFSLPLGLAVLTSIVLSPAAAQAKPTLVVTTSGQQKQQREPVRWGEPQRETTLSPNMSATTYQQGSDTGYNGKPEEWSSPHPQTTPSPALAHTSHHQGDDNGFPSKPDRWTTSFRLLFSFFTYSGAFK
jgi:hypothetical protein